MKRLDRVPEPALFRSFLVTVTGVVAFVIGKNVDTSWIESATVLYGIASPFIAGLLIRGAVRPASTSISIEDGLRGGR